MKVDFHCHTKKIKSGDPTTRNVTPTLFREKITSANIEIVAITNHNHFDFEQYNKLSEKVNDICQVWPGIELDIVGKSQKRGHLIVIANPDNVTQFNLSFKELFQTQNLENATLKLEEVYKKTKNLDVIYIFHFHKKPCVDENDIEELKILVGDDSRIFSETSDNRSLGVFANHGYNVMIGSDVKDWNEYEGCTFSELRLPVTSFAQFCKLSKRDDTVINTLLNKKNSYNLTAHPHKDVKLDLKIYSDINIIFGQKGTGKSEILKTLHTNLLNHGLTCKIYIGNDKDKEFSDLLKTDDMDKSVDVVKAEKCNMEFNDLFSYNDHNPTLITDYLDWYKTRYNSKNKAKLKITEAMFLDKLQESNLKNYKLNKIEFNKIIDSLNIIKVENYLCEMEYKELNGLLSKLGNSIYLKLFNEIIEKEAINITNFSIDEIKKISDKNSDTKSKPSSTGFSEFANKRLNIKSNAIKIINNITNKSYTEYSYLGFLENKGDIKIAKRYSMLNKLSIKQEFGTGIRTLRKVKNLLIEIKDNWYEYDILNKLTDLKYICHENRIDSTCNFLGKYKSIVTKDNSEYTPSSGEKSILLLQKLLETSADAYFLDEPELGMGNSYIDSTIRPQLMSLAKQRKVVVIATHNANIAVRTLPYVSIFRTHENNKYTTYIGNPFNDNLVNIDDSSDMLNWTRESMHTLEGGPEAFYERKDIYESGRN